MPADLLTAGMAAVRWSATYLLHSTFLFVGVWVFLRFRRAAGHALRESLWKMALVGGVATASFQLLLAPPAPLVQLTLAVDAFRPLAVGPSASIDGPARPADRADQRKAAALAELNTLAVDDSGKSGGGTAAWGYTEELSAPFDGSPQERAEGPEVLQPADRATHDLHDDVARRSIFAESAWNSAAAALLAAALAAIVVGVTRCAWQTVALKRCLARCSAIEDGPARRLLDELCRLVPRAPEVLLLSTADGAEPAAFGVRRWTIVLPHRAARDLTDDELRALLAHELAHLVRGDSTWLWISRLICSFLAFQPLNHLARREWQRAAEFLCDGWAVSRTGAPLALARCLAEVAGWRLSGRSSTALLAATGRKSGLADRIERLVEGADLPGSLGLRRERNRLFVIGPIVLCLVTWLAPRVQLAGAAAAVTEKASSEPAREEDLAQTRVEDQQVGVDAAIDSAKPQADGESDSREVSREAAPADMAALLAQLDSDLSDLQQELAELESLLKEHPSPPVARVAKQLRVEIGRLKQRRQILQVTSKTVSKIARNE